MIFLNIFLVAFLAFALSMVCGGGAGLLLIPLLGYALPAAQVPAALSIGTSVSSLTKLILFFQQIHWGLVRLFLPAAIPGVFLGAWLLSYLDPVYIELAMGMFLVSNLPYLFAKEAKASDKPAYPAWFLRGMGLLAGFISALTGAVGVLFNRVYLRYGLTKEQIVATRAANEIVLHLLKLVLYVWFGLFTLKALGVGMLVALAAVLSTYVMKYLLPHIPVRIFSKVGYVAMVFSGVILFNSAITRVQEAHNPDFDVTRVARGYDATFNWDDLLYTIEFKYGEGFEFEKIIPFSALDQARQRYVLAQDQGSSKIVIEKVYALSKISYEAYYYDESQQLIKKIKFD